VSSERLDHAAALAHVSAADPELGHFISSAGPLEERPGEGDLFGGLVRSIVYQQLAGAAAAAIHGRLVTALGGRVAAERLRDTSSEVLRSVGLSAAKAASLRDLAGKALDGTLRLPDMEGLPDDAVVDHLVRVRGVGRWTAQMVLMFELGRPDVWPVDDLGVRTGWRVIHRLPDNPTARTLQLAGERFRPYRSVVARYCWQAVRIDRLAAGSRGTTNV
jgi:DNA-3-methyladenine glycosylase II